MALESRLSPNYFRREELMQRCEIPPLSEIKLQAGLPLAYLIFEETHRDLKKDLGLIPFLKGVDGDLWMSPSDLLIGKVCLKPPLTQKHIQALTHEGILQIGSVIEQKFINEMLLEKDQAVKNKEEHLTRIFELRKGTLMREIREEVEAKQAEAMDRMCRVFEDKICQLVWECGEQVQRIEEEMEIEINSLNERWKYYLKEQIDLTVEKITGNFLEDLQSQELALTEIFNKKLEAVKLKAKCKLEFERFKSKELYLNLKHKMECRNIANLMFLLCKQKRKCELEIKIIESRNKSAINKKNCIIARKKRIVKKLKTDRDRKIEQFQVREKCLIAILRQFQKFIYYALKASPTQGEFLLNIDKLIKFELTDYCIEEERVIKENGNQLDPIIQTDPQPSLNSQVLLIKDSMDCDSKLETTRELEESDVLPAFYFNDKMYVREDFRDMLSAGIKIERDNPLWNPDVENLLNIFRETIESKRTLEKIKKVTSFHSSVNFINIAKLETKDDLLDPNFLSSKVENKGSQVSNEIFSMMKESEIIKKTPLALTKKGTKQNKKPKQTVMPKSNQTQSNQSLDAMSKRHNSSKIECTRDSLIIHISNIERKSLGHISKKAQEAASKSKSSDECFKTPSEGTDSNVSKTPSSVIDDNILQSRTSSTSEHSFKSLRKETNPTSKLVLAADSLELIKSSTALSPERPKQKDSPTTNSWQPSPPPAKPLKTPRTLKRAQAQSSKVKPGKTSNPKSNVRVVGDPRTLEHEKSPDIFTEERIKSLVSVMRTNPSLIRLFTSCSK